MKAAKILGAHASVLGAATTEQSQKSDDNSLAIDISDVPMYGDQMSSQQLRASGSGNTIIQGGQVGDNISPLTPHKGAVSSSTNTNVPITNSGGGVQLSVDPPLQKASRNQEISPFLFQGEQNDHHHHPTSRFSLANHSNTTNNTTTTKGGAGGGRISDHAIGASGGSGSTSRFSGSTPARTATPPLSHSASQHSLGTSITPNNAASKKAKSTLKGLFVRKKSSIVTLGNGTNNIDQSSSSSSTSRSQGTLPLNYNQGSFSSKQATAATDIRDGNALGIDEEIGADEQQQEPIRDTKRRFVRPRTRDKDSKKSMKINTGGGSSFFDHETLPITHERSQNSHSDASKQNNVALALDTNFDTIDDFVDTSLRQSSIVGPKDELLTPRESLRAGGPPSPTSPKQLRDRATSVSFVEQQRTMSISLDSPQRPMTLRRLATASGTSFPLHRPIGQPVRADITDPQFRKLTKQEAQALLASRNSISYSAGGATAMTKQNSANVEREQGVLRDSVAWADKRTLPQVDPTLLERSKSIIDERKASYASSSSRMTNGSDISPTTSVNNIAKLSARPPNERRPSTQGQVDASYKFPPNARALGGGDPRKSSTSSGGKVASSWMAPDSWAVQPDRLRDHLRDEDDDDTNDEEMSPRIDPLTTSPSYKRDARHPSIATSLWSNSAGVPLQSSMSSTSDGQGTHSFSTTADGQIRDARRETMESALSGSSLKTDFDSLAAPADSSLEILQTSSDRQHSSSISGPSSSGTTTAQFRPTSRGGSTIANAAGKLGLHLPRTTKSRPGTATQTNPNGKVVAGLPSTPSMEDEIHSPYRAATKRPGTAQGPLKQTFMRIYKNDGTHSVVGISLEATAAELRSILLRKNIDPSQVNRLFVRDKGSERPLGEFEKPAMLQRRRLEQAGYTEDDSLDQLGREDLSFLLKFVYRPDRVTNFESYSFGNTEAEFSVLDLRNRNLEMVPIFLYKHAEWIQSLDLSGNPMHDIPLDFVQLCTNLTTLCLSHLSLKRIPQSIRQAVHLTHLDISDNRILELSHVNLGEIPLLMSLKAQNNRLMELPQYFADLQNLHDLNLSNNRFETFPQIMCQLRGLQQLDISFNTIAKLPEQISDLTELQRMILVGNLIEHIPASMSRMTNLKAVDIRRNHLQDVSLLFDLPRLELLKCEHNSIKKLDVTFGSYLKVVEVGQNPLSKATFRAQSM